jgi:SAM-dependent methyltransferase
MDAKEDFLQKLYNKRITGFEDYRNTVWRILCKHYFSKLISPEAHVLDLGAGWCEFINNVSAANKHAMDLNPETGFHLSTDTIFIHQDCSQPWNVNAGSLDVVFTSNLFEHLPDKESIERTINEAYKSLKDGGLIICIGPNIKYAPGAYWDFWDHHIPLTETSLGEILEMRGFELDVCVDRFLPFSMTIGANPPTFLVALYLKMPFLWRFFGKQFLVIGRKVNRVRA